MRYMDLLQLMNDACVVFGRMEVYVGHHKKDFPRNTGRDIKELHDRIGNVSLWLNTGDWFRLSEEIPLPLPTKKEAA